MPKSDEQGYFLTYIGLLLGLLGLLLPIKTTFIWQWLVVWNMNFIFPFSWECISGWWFGTFGLFSHWVGNVIIPTDELHYFSEGRSTTSQDMIDIHSMDWFFQGKSQIFPRNPGACQGYETGPQFCVFSFPMGTEVNGGLTRGTCGKIGGTYGKTMENPYRGL